MQFEKKPWPIISLSRIMHQNNFFWMKVGINIYYTRRIKIHFCTQIKYAQWEVQIVRTYFEERFRGYTMAIHEKHILKQT